MNQILYVFLGLIGGILSGFLGIGGGILFVPAFIFLLGMSQHQAQGTTLALMVPPIGLLAAWQYYTKGNVKVGVAAFVCIGFFFGGLIGAQLVQKVPELMLRKFFAVFLAIVAVKLFIGK